MILIGYFAADFSVAGVCVFALAGDDRSARRVQGPVSEKLRAAGTRLAHAHAEAAEEAAARSTAPKHALSRTGRRDGGGSAASSSRGRRAFRQPPLLQQKPGGGLGRSRGCGSGTEPLPSDCRRRGVIGAGLGAGAMGAASPRPLALALALCAAMGGSAGRGGRSRGGGVSLLPVAWQK